ncbi:MAG: permease [Alphaproteobacteria bacterium]|nr:permease [Alphaproteobacteria bacterium SS10]
MSADTSISPEGVSRSGGCCPKKAAGPPTLWQRVRAFDWMLWGSAVLVVAGYITFLLSPEHSHGALHHYAHGVFELMNTLWWGLLLGIIFVGLMDRMPKELVMKAMSGNRPATGIAKATAAGVLFDLCSHGILMVGMKLYERGATIGQTLAFLLASPWNSISLTIILIALIGWEWTLAFVILSAIIGMITGLIADGLVARGKLPDNPNREGVEIGDHSLMSGVKEWMAGLKPSGQGTINVIKDGFRGGRIVMRWILFGVVLASLIRAFVPADVFAEWFGPGLMGLFLTVIVATIVEVCSEGSAPIAADIINRAGAPGNGFTFLMAGVATDYTEIMSLRETTGRWVLAFALPIISVPQTVVVAALINHLYTV